MATNNPPIDDTRFKFQQDILLKEVDYLQTRVAHFDELSFKIKGWAVGLWSGIVAFGTSENVALVVTASTPVMLSLWILDGYFKQYQRRCLNRLSTIEAFLASIDDFEDNGLHKAFADGDFGDFPIHDPVATRTRQLYPAIEDRHSATTSFESVFLTPNLAFFYLIPIASALLIALVI